MRLISYGVVGILGILWYTCFKVPYEGLIVEEVYFWYTKVYQVYHSFLSVILKNTRFIEGYCMIIYRLVMVWLAVC